jgi:hypothetical protein
MLLRPRERSPVVRPENSRCKVRFALDSGAFTWSEEKDRTDVVTARARMLPHLERYIAYVKRNAKRFEFYAAMDSIYNPVLSDELLQIMLAEKLTPVPVYHYGAPEKYFRKYAAAHPYIAIGGLARSKSGRRIYDFCRPLFRYLGNTSAVRVHAFGVYSASVLAAFRWASADTSTWVQEASRRRVHVPHMGLCGSMKFHRQIVFRVKEPDENSNSRLWLQSFGTVDLHDPITLRAINAAYLLCVQKEVRKTNEAFRMYLAFAGDSPRYIAGISDFVSRNGFREISYLASFSKATKDWRYS